MLNRKMRKEIESLKLRVENLEKKLKEIDHITYVRKDVGALEADPIETIQAILDYLNLEIYARRYPYIELVKKEDKDETQE